MGWADLVPLAARLAMVAGAAPRRGSLDTTALAFSGRWREAIEAINRALCLSPRDPFVAFSYASGALAHYFSGNYQEAIRMCQGGHSPARGFCRGVPRAGGGRQHFRPRGSRRPALRELPRTSQTSRARGS